MQRMHPGLLHSAWTNIGTATSDYILYERVSVCIQLQDRTHDHDFRVQKGVSTLNYLAAMWCRANWLLHWLVLLTFSLSIVLTFTCSILQCWHLSCVTRINLVSSVDVVVITLLILCYIVEKILFLI